MSRKYGVVGAVLVTLVFSLLYVRSRFLMLEIGYRVSKSEKEYVQKKQQKNFLMLELSMLKNPKRIRKVAQKDLNLRADLTPISVVMKSSGVNR